MGNTTRQSITDTLNSFNYVEPILVNIQDEISEAKNNIDKLGQYVILLNPKTYTDILFFIKTKGQLDMHVTTVSIGGVKVIRSYDINEGEFMILNRHLPKV